MQIKVIGTQAISSIQVRTHLALHGYNIKRALYMYAYIYKSISMVYNEFLDCKNHIHGIIPMT